MNFNHKITLVTGAGSGIGQATALLFARQGATVIVSDVQPEKGAETVAAIGQAGGNAEAIPSDVSIFSQVEKLIGTIVQRHGRLDIAVNNAGIGAKALARTAEHSLEDWERVVAVNQTGLFYCLKLELAQMQAQGNGCIVNVASMAGLRGLPNNLAYVASKHAVVGMTKTAALEYARDGIRVNAVCPAFTHSPLFQKLLDSKAGLHEKLLRTIPMGRFGEAAEVAESIAWLCSDGTGFVTGVALPVDGGNSA